VKRYAVIVFEIRDGMDDGYTTDEMVEGYVSATDYAAPSSWTFEHASVVSSRAELDHLPFGWFD
jgi:hypothetical protein